tara:strand:- start:633 stop:803 length:171 start_codon:yes stop_codon:yes gene_type:complete
MTALPKLAPKLNLRRRGRNEVAAPNPAAGDHRTLVRRALVDTMAKHGDTIKELSKV